MLEKVITELIHSNTLDNPGEERNPDLKGDHCQTSDGEFRTSGLQLRHQIFIADDEPSVRHAIRLLLEQAGFAIVGEAGDAETLLAQVCISPPGVILLDWELPGLRAQSLLPALRKYCSGAKVVALSVRPEARQLALAMDVDAFVSKGDPSDELLAVLGSIATDERTE